MWCSLVWSSNEATSSSWFHAKKTCNFWCIFVALGENVVFFPVTPSCNLTKHGGMKSRWLILLATSTTAARLLYSMMCVYVYLEPRIFAWMASSTYIHGEAHVLLMLHRRHNYNAQLVQMRRLRCIIRVHMCGICVVYYHQARPCYVPGSFFLVHLFA